ncbi:MAG: hypothetical protein CL944_01045 [Candidatus Diapherotrites archaeon]|uniref:Uncharacterized protein n=1 Tax=Candidatus Iainarchaeum sp. TaxID=3101447 RepID=A0A2D6LPE3_9ARCH|nr:hypothetical protein [Candidatus Diapherotrites archaeon]
MNFSKLLVITVIFVSLVGIAISGPGGPGAAVGQQDPGHDLSDSRGVRLYTTGDATGWFWIMSPADGANYMEAGSVAPFELNNNNIIGINGNNKQLHLGRLVPELITSTGSVNIYGDLVVPNQIRSGTSGPLKLSDTDGVQINSANGFLELRTSSTPYGLSVRRPGGSNGDASLLLSSAHNTTSGDSTGILNAYHEGDTTVGEPELILHDGGTGARKVEIPSGVKLCLNLNCISSWPTGSGSADNWGTQTVQSDANLTGDGTTLNPLSVVGGTGSSTLLEVLDENSDASGFTGTTTLGGPLAIGATNAPSGILALNAGAGGYDVGITQGKVGLGNTLELTTGDALGNQSTKFLIRGGSDTSNIEFYKGADGAETLSMQLTGSTGDLDVEGNICANAFGGTPSCLTSSGPGGGSRQIKFVDIAVDPTSGTVTFDFDPAFVLIISSGWGDADSSWVAFQGDTDVAFTGDYGSQETTIYITLQGNTLDYTYTRNYTPRVVFIAFQ